MRCQLFFSHIYIFIPCSQKYYRDMRERHRDKIMRLKAEYHRDSTYPL